MAPVGGPRGGAIAGTLCSPGREIRDSTSSLSLMLRERDHEAPSAPLHLDLWTGSCSPPARSSRWWSLIGSSSVARARPGSRRARGPSVPSARCRGSALTSLSGTLTRRSTGCRAGDHAEATSGAPIGLRSHRGPRHKRVGHMLDTLERKTTLDDESGSPVE
jgi:hypothetical protein